MFVKDLIKKFFVSHEPKPDASLGERGENVAAKHLRNLGYTILQRNYRSKAGEIDIVARQGRILVFVEVKTRVDEQVRPEDQVNSEKMHQIITAAKLYLSRFGSPRPASRFDVIAIVWPQGREPMIRHHENAFVEGG